MKSEWKELLENPEFLKNLIGLMMKSHYDFFKGIQEHMTEAEFEEFCKEFPEARMVQNT